MADSHKILVNHKATWFISNSGTMTHDLFTFYNQMELDRLAGHASSIAPIRSASTKRGAGLPSPFLTDPINRRVAHRYHNN
ncbi:hypothetical protein K438DRAFT_1977434 [Mycena galopus ATCC 62051]|nr:hypothetical protein K438DRAFT_1977434 [Mycena galopus ATCC 62051]